MSTPKSARKLGFNLDELETQVRQHDRTAPAATATAVGRPRSLSSDAVSFSVRLSRAQRDWLVHEAAQRTLARGERFDTSMLVRELIDQARAGQP